MSLYSARRSASDSSGASTTTVNSRPVFWSAPWIMNRMAYLPRGPGKRIKASRPQYTRPPRPPQCPAVPAALPNCGSERRGAPAAPMMNPGVRVMSEMAKTCTHLDMIRDVSPTAPGCEECLRTGGQWVHLRMCRTCGHVGCCDSSPGKHARKHAHRAGHPIVRSIEPGETWSWCFVDEVMFEEQAGYAAAGRIPRRPSGYVRRSARLVIADSLSRQTRRAWFTSAPAPVEADRLGIGCGRHPLQPGTPVPDRQRATACNSAVPTPRARTSSSTYRSSSHKHRRPRYVEKVKK